MPSPVGSDVHCTRSPLLSSAPIQPRSSPVARVSAANVSAAGGGRDDGRPRLLLCRAARPAGSRTGARSARCALTAIARPSSSAGDERGSSRDRDGQRGDGEPGHERVVVRARDEVDGHERGEHAEPARHGRVRPDRGGQAAAVHRDQQTAGQGDQPEQADRDEQVDRARRRRRRGRSRAGRTGRRCPARSPAPRRPTGSRPAAAPVVYGSSPVHHRSSPGRRTRRRPGWPAAARRAAAGPRARR